MKRLLRLLSRIGINFYRERYVKLGDGFEYICRRNRATGEFEWGLPPYPCVGLAAPSIWMSKDDLRVFLEEEIEY